MYKTTTKAALGLLFLFITTVATAQYQPIQNYGQKHKRIIATTFLGIPHGDPAQMNSTENGPALWYSTLDNTLYLWNGTSLIPIAVSSGSGYVPATRTITINGVTLDLSANRSWTVSATPAGLQAVTDVGNLSTNWIGTGGFQLKSGGLDLGGLEPNVSGAATGGQLWIKDLNSVNKAYISADALTATRTLKLPNESGTLATREYIGAQSFVTAASLANYYTKTNLQTAGQALVNYLNLTNVPALLTPSAAAATYQPLDADLSAIAGQTSTGFLKRTGPDTWALDASSYLTGNQSINFAATGDASGSATGTTALSPNMTVTGLRGAPLPALAAGTLKYTGSAWTFDNSTYLSTAAAASSYQPLDADLTAIAASASTGFLKRTGTNTWAFDASTYLTANQAISWTSAGDIAGSASGSTSISPSLTVNGLKGAALPALAAGYLKWTGAAFIWDNAPSGSGGTISLSGDASGSGTTSIATTITGLRGSALPALATGNLRYNGSAWTFDNTSYLTQTAADALYQPIGSYLTANQTITLSGDLSGSGATAISGTVNGLKGAALPTLAAGYLHYTGSAWTFDAPSGTLSGLTTNRIPFASSSNTLTDNSNLFWNATNAGLMVGTNVDISYQKPKIGVSKGTTSQSGGIVAAVTIDNRESGQTAGTNYALSNTHVVTGTNSGDASGALFNNIYLDGATYSYSTNNMWAASRNLVTLQNGAHADRIVNTFLATQVYNSSSITSAYFDLYLEAPLLSGGGSIANYYGIYQEYDQALNVFYGKTLLGSASDAGAYKLQVTGDAYFNGIPNFQNYLKLKEISSPSTPATGYGALYPKSDGLLYYKNSAGTETALGGGSGSSYTFGKGLTNTSGSVSLGQAPVSATDADYTVASTDYYVVLPTITANRNITLPNPTGANSGRQLILQNGNTSANSWAFITYTPKEPNGNSNTTFSSGTNLALVSNGTDWVRNDNSSLAVLKQGTTTFSGDAVWALGSTNEIQVTGNQNSNTIFTANNSGTTNANGLQGIAGGSGYGVYGSTATGTGTYGTASSNGNGIGGNSSSGNGGSFSSTSGSGIFVSTNTGAQVARIWRNGGTTTNDLQTSFSYVRFNSSGTVANGYGLQDQYQAQDAGGSAWTMGYRASYWNDATATTHVGGFRELLTKAAGTTTVSDVVPLYNSTGDATPTSIGAFVIPDESAGLVEITVVARQGTTTGSLVGRKMVSYRKDGGVLTIGSFHDILADEIQGSLTGATWSAAVNGSNNLEVTVTGLASTSINWRGSIRINPTY